MGDDEAPRIAVAMLTYRRPDALRAAMASIQPQLAEIKPPATLIVVDNEPSGAAHDVVVDASDPDALIQYVHEPRPGISAARNSALKAAAKFDALVFIDDDEIATPGWLARLTQSWQEMRSAAVAGPVEPVFATQHDADTWIARSGAFDRKRHATGERLVGFATNNVLLDMSFLRAHDLSFAEELGLVGGEDTLLSRQVIACGGEVRWCDDAVVTEIVVSNRLTGRWVRRRAFRSGASWSHAILAVAEPHQRTSLVLQMVFRAVIKVPVGLVQWCVGVVARRPRLAYKGSDAVCSLSGALFGVAGGSVREYGRPAVPTG